MHLSSAILEERPETLQPELGPVPVADGGIMAEMPRAPKNRLYFGDNLNILRREIPDESVDLIYLDPPFNSNANYNVLFKESSGEQSAAQIATFDDTWPEQALSREHLVQNQERNSSSELLP